MGQPEPGDGIVKPDLALLCWNPALPERQVPAYRQVRKQVSFLKHIGQGSLMGRPEQVVCLPGRAEYGKLSLGLLQPGGGGAKPQAASGGKGAIKELGPVPGQYVSTYIAVPKSKRVPDKLRPILNLKHFNKDETLLHSL